MLASFMEVTNKILAKKLRLKRKKITQPIFGDPISPPGSHYEGYFGFVSSPRNNQGMQACIFIDEKTGGACCRWRPSASFESYPSLIHGGIGFALLDDVMAHAVYAQTGYIGFTTRSKTKWLGVLRTDKDVIGKAKIVRRVWRLVKVSGWIFDEQGKLLIASTAIFYLPSRKQLCRILNNPNIPEETLNSCLL